MAKKGAAPKGGRTYGSQPNLGSRGPQLTRGRGPRNVRTAGARSLAPLGEARIMTGAKKRDTKKSK